MTLAGLTLLWTIATLSELRLFVISGTIAQWYWAVGSHAGSTLRSLRQGLTSSFGSLALGGAVLTLIQVARNALQQCVAPWTTHPCFFICCAVMRGSMGEKTERERGVGTYAGSTLRSLQQGLTSSFGSLALGGAVLTLIQVVRNVLQQCMPC
jgi:hypothetical protein